MRKITASFALSVFLLPATAFALPGVGPRVTIDGEISDIRITDQQRFDNEGAELSVQASNGQTVTVVIDDATSIVTEGRLSRKKVRPTDLRVGVHVRVRGWRVDTDALTASLIVVTNVEANPGLSGNGVISGFDGSSVTLETSDGTVVSYTVDEDTEVFISYTLKGAAAMSIIGKQALFSVSPTDTSRLKVLRITGEPQQHVDRPAVRELRTTRYRRK